MPLKKDASGRRYVEMELELPGTPEQIWQAVATGPGYTAWFVPTDLEERVGGAITFHLFGDVISSGHVTAWEPPHRFAYEEPNWSGEAPPVATEITIEAHAGGTCTMRMVHSLFTERDDWDKEVEGFESGWPGFFVILRIYLRDFAGMHAAALHPRGNFAGTHEEAWRRMKSLLDLEGAVLGERRSTSAKGAPRLAGTVEHIGEKASNREITLKLEEPSAGVAMVGSYEWGGQVHTAVYVIFYGDDADAMVARERPAWTAWMNEHFKAIPQAQ
jgi:uncharacterized protein YndB with AHSA1/START domain